jgi:glycerophosphoryl diester phosphodiesterase
MKTFREIVEKFESAADFHIYIQSFGFGNIDRLNDTINQPYPLLWVRPLGSLGVSPYGQRTLTFEVFMLEIPKGDDSNYIQAYSDSERALYDVYTFFRDGAEQQEYQINMLNITPVSEAFQDRAIGFVSQMEIITDSAGLTICNIPTNQ